MAELLLSVVAERIIGTLGSLASKEIGLLWGVQDELQSLKNTISTIKDVLLDAEEKKAAGDRAVKGWLERLEDAMYDADDMLDEVSTEALQRDIMIRDKKAKKVRIFFSESNQLAFRHKTAHKIKAIRKRLDAINADRRFHLEVRPVETRVGNRERDNTHSVVLEEEVIGREEDKNAIVHRLVNSNVEENVSILPIVGIGGLGKTTFAQLIFNDDQIQKHFELRMWVCVSDTFDVKIIVEKILESATKEKPIVYQMDTLVGKLKKEIDGKKYFLVLDDVWNEDDEKWCCLKKVLMGGARGSRILVTTRNETVARTIRRESVARIIGTVESHLLSGLDEDASWSLFKQKAFENGQELENSCIVALGKEILQKCLGVPLAIRTIGSLLGSKNPETEWLSFKNNELSKIFPKENGIIPTLKLSYDHLPSHLKHCFAYCSLFPKDYEIEKSTLIKLWIAQGFVKLSDKQEVEMEEVGNEYFMDLLLRSFFQEAKMDDFGNVIECKMHDLMHDLAISVAGSLITTLDDKKRNIDEKARHVLVAYGINISHEVPTLLCKASKMRTFLGIGKYFKANIDCDATFSSSKFLRVLDLHNDLSVYSPFDRLQNLSSIGKLKHLRYLDLSGNTYMKKLPDSITNLQNLQTLRLSNCRLLKELPRDIKKLVNLRHLEIDSCYELSYMPLGLGQLTNLQTLSTFCVHSTNSHSRHGGSGGLQELKGLNKLRGELKIVNMGREKGVASECKAASLNEKQHLHTLRIWWSAKGDVENSDVVEDEASLEGFQPHSNLKYLYLRYYLGSKLSSWILLLKNLVTFRLESCRKFQYLPSLSQLPSLKELFLIDLEAIEYMSDDDDSNEFSSSSTAPTPFFPSLKYIWLYKCPNLKGWWRKRDSSVEVNNSVEITEHRLLPSFPRLSKLVIKSCPMLTSMPMFPHLEEELDLDDASSKPLQQTIMMNMVAPQSPTSTAIDSSSFTPLSKLKSIKMDSIADLETLPLQNLTSLESLRIDKCNKLKTLSLGIQHLTPLQDQDIGDCPDLELANDEDVIQWQGLTSLLSLSFSSLPKLVSLPSGLQHATTLQKLMISRCESLTAIPEWIHNCKSLQLLEIRYCSKLASLPKGISRLTSLQKLDIMDCPDLELANDEDGMQLQGLTSLHSLWFSSLPKLVSFPSGLQHATTLKKLRIWRCESLTAIPEWIHNCKSLQLLDIDRCSRLASLPKGISQLTSLQKLTIWGCPILLQRCKRHTGEDWPKIAHIPELDLWYPPQQEENSFTHAASTDSGIYYSSFYLNPS
jgi:Leucine-rich repeat (LRR) protein